ncbi:MAG: hypothetical protein KC776_43950 [Myxococcales bacterium]|nr:hypothetical protein [Myxococcales bacterium]MCB9575623.1 hypothetical protein [Polyangiaceae bacterium]
MRRALLAAVFALGLAPSAHAQEIPLDRVVVRFIAPETGGMRSPRFIFERVLAFEARLEALADPDRAAGSNEPYRERHVRAAMERHISETLLASVRIDPEPTAKELSRQTEAARLILYQQCGGALAVEQAAIAEGMDDREILRILRRRARASLYLDRMVAPMLAPSRAELQSLHRTTQTPFRNRPFDEIEPALRRWYVGRRLAQALENFYQNARSRLEVKIVH